MTQVTMLKQKNMYIGFEIQGHSGYDMAGKDIVCAAISTIAQATARGITDVLGIDVEEETNDAKGYMRFLMDLVPDSRLAHAQTLLKTMELTLKDIQWQYKDFLQVCTKDVDMI